MTDDIDELVAKIREQVPGLEHLTRNDVFMCHQLTPWTPEVKNKYIMTVHPNTNDGVCQDCGLNLKEIE